MVNCNKLAIYVFVIVIIVMTHFAAPSFPQEKPSLYVINMIITRLVMQESVQKILGELATLK